MAYRIASNAFFRDLLVSSFVFHSSLLTVKSIDWVVAYDGFLCIMEIVCIFHSGRLDYRGTFKFILLCNELNVADREGQWIRQFQTIPGACSTIVFFIVAKRDYRRTF